MKRDELWSMVDKITTVAKSKLGKRIGRLDHDDVIRLNRTMIVFSGLAATGLRGWPLR